MRLTAVVLALAMVICVAAPTAAVADPLETFGGVLYEKTIYSETGSGGVSGSFRTGVRVPGSNWWVGAQAVEVSGTGQGGVGPSVFWADSIGWLKNHVSFIADLGYLSEIKFDPETGEYKWGPAGGGGIVVHGSKETHLALGLRFYPDEAGGNFMSRVSFAGGLFISDPYKQLGRLFSGIGKVFGG